VIAIILVAFFDCLSTSLYVLKHIMGGCLTSKFQPANFDQKPVARQTDRQKNIWQEHAYSIIFLHVVQRKTSHQKCHI